jgi:2-keto-4-pentenoate hydratase/2-oxohepta-3-ene-1,7-dioic acid hydratase in catechol pathway
VIATGTPARTAAAPDAPEFLQPGDVVRITIEKIGELVNPVAAEERVHPESQPEERKG